jgi:hypothetical protein
MSDAQLNALGLSIPAPERIKPYHANSALGDIRGHWLGKRVAAAALEMASDAMGQETGKRKETAVAQKMREEMVMSLRLTTISNMSQGTLVGKRFDLLLHALNNRWLRFIGRLLRP